MVDSAIAGVSGRLDRPRLVGRALRAGPIRRSGAFCARYCGVVIQHHGLEDDAIFPHLVRSESTLGPVIDRLTDEHRVIHDAIVLSSAVSPATAMVGGVASEWLPRGYRPHGP